jgi:hypothetical protein
MIERKFQLSLVASIFLLAALLLTESTSAADEETALDQEVYLNCWGPDKVRKNAHDWKKVTDIEGDNIGLNEISIYPPETEPTPQHVKAADELVVNSLAAAMRHNWFDFKMGEKDGYELYDAVHYINMDYVDDGRVLDPDRPETLMYYPTKKGIKLVGVMYLMSDHEQRGPQIGGPLTLWHFHLNRRPHCWFNFPDFARNLNGTCRRKEMTRRSPEMLHVWFVDHPDGPFASEMTLPKVTMEAIECMSAPQQPGLPY